MGAAATWFCLLISVLPALATVAAALTPTWREGPFAGGLTLAWLTQAFEQLRPQFSNSLEVAVVVLIVDGMIGVPLAWMLARRSFTGARLVVHLARLPLAIPGIAIGLALASSYPGFRSSGLLLVAGHVLFTLPFVLAALVPTLGDQRLIDLEAVAATLGASFALRFTTITLPTVRTALIATGLMVLTLSLGEFNASFFVVPPAEQTLPFGLYSAYITQRIEIASAGTTLFLLLVVPASVLLQRTVGSSLGRVGQA